MHNVCLSKYSLSVCFCDNCSLIFNSEIRKYTKNTLTPVNIASNKLNKILPLFSNHY